MQELVFEPKGQLTIEDMHCWMDGGTINFITKDMESNCFDIQFTQRMILTGLRPDNPMPGSLLLNNIEIPIRSGLEVKVLTAIKQAQWGIKIPEHERSLNENIRNECIRFVLSDHYLEVAKIVGRLS